jgi:hypothetical protein
LMVPRQACFDCIAGASEAVTRSESVLGWSSSRCDSSLWTPESRQNRVAPS